MAKQYVYHLPFSSFILEVIPKKRISIWKGDNTLLKIWRHSDKKGWFVNDHKIELEIFEIANTLFKECTKQIVPLWDIALEKFVENNMTCQNKG